MSDEISRMYDNPVRANSAVDELKRNEYHRFTDIYVTTQSNGSQSGSDDQLVATLMSAMILKSRAKIYAEGVKRGGTLVTVHAPFGSGLTAAAILDSHGPIDAGYVKPSATPYLWDDTAPCSSALRMRVLLPDSATFSKFWNVRPLAAGGMTTSSCLGLPEVKKSSRSYEPTIPLAMLSTKGTILSSMLSLPVLKTSRARSARR